jgi:hypothetical protein
VVKKFKFINKKSVIKKMFNNDYNVKSNVLNNLSSYME